MYCLILCTRVYSLPLFITCHDYLFVLDLRRGLRTRTLSRLIRFSTHDVLDSVFDFVKILLFTIIFVDANQVHGVKKKI